MAYESTVHGRTKGQALKTNGLTKYTYHRGLFSYNLFRNRCNPKFKRFLHCFNCSLLIFFKFISLNLKQGDIITACFSRIVLKKNLIPAKQLFGFTH